MNKTLDLTIQDAAQFETILKRYTSISGGNPVPISVSPYFISSNEYYHLKNQCEHVLAAIECLLRKYTEEPDMQAMFPELQAYRHLSLRKPAYKNWIHLARFDIVQMSDGRFKLLETNCDCPGAIAQISIMKQAYIKLACYDKTVAPLQPISQPMDSPDFFTHSLVKLYQELKGTTTLPMVSFFSSLYRPILTDLELLNVSAQRLGIHSAHIPIQTLTLANQRLAFKKQIIDIAYQKFDAFIDEHDQAKPCIYENHSTEVSAYWQAIHDDSFIYVNSFPSALVAENKRILHLLQDPQFKVLFTQEQQSAIEELCIPTFPLQDQTSADREIIMTVMKNKDQYVLKRVIDTQGRGVILGKHCELDKWQTIIREAINRPYVIQHYIQHPQHHIYSAIKPYQHEKIYTNLAVFMITGKVAGMFCRSSVDPITNVARQGCLRPVFIIP